MLNLGKALFVCAAGVVAAQAHAFDVDLSAAGVIGENSYKFIGDNGKSDVKGADLRFHASFSGDEHFFVRGQYLLNKAKDYTLDDVKYDGNLSWNVAKFGVGLGSELGPIRAYGVIDYVNYSIKLDNPRNNFAGNTMSLGLSDKGESKWLWSGEFSVINTGALGTGWDARVGYRFTKHLAAVVGAQTYDFKKPQGDPRVKVTSSQGTTTKVNAKFGADLFSAGVQLSF